MALHSRIFYIFLPITAMLPLIFLAAIWNRFSQTVSLHFSIHSEADRFGPKFLMGGIFLFIMAVGLLLCFRFQKASVCRAFLLLVLISLLNILFILAVLNGPKLLDRFGLPLIELMIARIGERDNKSICFWTLIAAAVISVVIPSSGIFPVFIITLAVITVIQFIYFYKIGNSNDPAT